MHISANMKMVDVIHSDIQVLAVIQLLSIPLGFREKTVQEICEEHNVDIDFFLEIANTYVDKSHFPDEKFMNFPVEWIINYLKRAHKCYLEHRIPQIDKQINELETNSASNANNVTLILNFFKEYVKEFNSHILLEEKDVFPYILELNSRLTDKNTSPEIEGNLTQSSIEHYLEEHNNIEEKLFDLKNILLKYLPPPMDDCTYTHLLFDIFRLENDLKGHADLEEKVLFPKVRLMEEKIRKMNSSN